LNFESSGVIKQWWRKDADAYQDMLLFQTFKPE
jgi:hypothetical protein